MFNDDKIIYESVHSGFAFSGRLHSWHTTSIVLPQALLTHDQWQ